MASTAPAPPGSPAHPRGTFLWPSLPPGAASSTQALLSSLVRAEPTPWVWPGPDRAWPSVCLHSHCHPAALPVSLHLLLGAAGGLAPVPGAHRGARRQCRPHAILLHAGLGRACLHHRYPPPPARVLRVYIPRASAHLYATFSHIHPRPGGRTSLCPGPSSPQASLWFNSVPGSPTQGEGPPGQRGWHGQRVDRTLPPLHLALGAHQTT